MIAPPRQRGACIPGPAYGVVVIVIVLVCYAIVAHEGSNAVLSAEAVIGVALTAARIAGWLPRPRRGNRSGFNKLAN
jgi:hypothetical protein